MNAGIKRIVAIAHQQQIIVFLLLDEAALYKRKRNNAKKGRITSIPITHD